METREKFFGAVVRLLVALCILALGSTVQGSGTAEKLVERRARLLAPLKKMAPRLLKALDAAWKRMGRGVHPQ